MSLPGDNNSAVPAGPQLQLIRSYGPGRFSIAGRDWRGPILVTPTITFDWPVTSAAELSLESFAALERAPLPTELVVLGCGARPIQVGADVRSALKAAGMTLEVVDTGSACRIYNVLVAESRRVAAALIPL